MEYRELESAVALLDGELATIRLRRDPSREFLAEIEYCAEQEGVGYVYLFWVDRRTLAAYAETLTGVKAEDIIALRKSGIPVESCTTAYLGDDWESTLRDVEVFPQSSERRSG
jgi:hypothetical protein